MGLRRGGKAGPGTMHVCVGLLAAAGGALGVQGSRVFCRFAIASRTRIQYQDGYAEALSDIAEFICREAAGQPLAVPIDERISAVAAAQAEAIAGVISTCAGDRDAQLQVRSRRRAEAQASAIGAASASAVASSGVCGLCEAGREAIALAMDTLTARAIANIDFDASAQVGGEPITVGVVQQQLQAAITDRLSTAVDELRSGGDLEACSPGSAVPDFCNAVISAGGISTEVDAAAAAGRVLQRLACDGADSFLEAELKLMDVAAAAAQAVAQASASCETNGRPGTVACGLTRSTIDAVAHAIATAFATAIAEAYGPECDCDVFGRLDAEAMTTIIAEASAASLAEVCVDGKREALADDFQSTAENRVGEAIAEALVGVHAGDIACATVLALGGFKATGLP